jgi:hypothetical protein
LGTVNRRVALYPILIVTSAALIWWGSGRSQATTVPACAWRMGEDSHQGRPYEEVPPGTAIRFAAFGPQPMHWYVASHSELDGTLALFPSPQLATSANNPLPAEWTQLPGRHGEQELAWGAREDGGVTTFVAIATVEPIADLAATLARCRQASNTTFPDGSYAVTNPRDERSFAGPPHTPIAHPLLAEAAALPPDSPNGPMHASRTVAGAFLSSWRTVTAKSRAGSAEPAHPR